MTAFKHVQTSIPTTLHHELRLRALQTDSTVAEIVRGLITEHIERPRAGLEAAIKNKGAHHL